MIFRTVLGIPLRNNTGRFETVRVAACEVMGLGDFLSRVVPEPTLIVRPAVVCMFPDADSFPANVIQRLGSFELLRSGLPAS